MVGVLRSKACNACRARRKKCDEQHPVCGACLKRGAKCVYRKDINFVFFQPPTTDALDNASESNGSSSSSDSSGSPDVDPTAITRYSTPFDFSADYTTPFDLPTSVLLSANTSRAYGYFLDNYLPRSSRSLDLNSNTVGFASSAWYKTAGLLASSDPLLSDVLLALSLKYTEQVHKSQHAAYQAALAYNRAVRNISYRLGSPDDSLSDSTLAAVMALTTWEAQNATSKGALGWLTHVKGSLMLVQLRGSLNFATDFGKELYLGSLLANLIGAIGGRKALPSLPALDNTIFQGDCASYAKLFQILYAVPGILEQCDKVQAAADAKAPHSEMVTKASIMSYLVRDFEMRLSEWSSQLLETPDDPLFWQEPSALAARLPRDSPDRVLTTFYSFRSLDLGQQLVFSWACDLLANLALATNVRAIHENGYPDVSFYATDFDMMSIFKKLYKLATDILTSFEYFLHPDVGQTAIDFLGLPVNLVYGFMRPKGFPECRWFNVLFERMHEVSPGFGGFLQAMAEQGGGGRAFKMLVQKQKQMPVVHNAYSDTTEILPGS